LSDNGDINRAIAIEIGCSDARWSDTHRDGNSEWGEAARTGGLEDRDGVAAEIGDSDVDAAVVVEIACGHTIRIETVGVDGADRNVLYHGASDGGDEDSNSIAGKVLRLSGVGIGFLGAVVVGDDEIRVSVSVEIAGRECDGSDAAIERATESGCE